MKIANVIVPIVASCIVQAGWSADAQPLQRSNIPPVGSHGQTTSEKAGAQPARRKWVRAVYRGLIVGKSSKADALRVLGKPKRTGKESETLTPFMDFDVSEPVPGKLSVFLDHDIITEISLTPEKRYAKDSIIKILGPGYITVHYSLDECLGEGGSGPIYEDPRGEFESLEYRARGIAIDIHNDGDIGEITYVKGPLGPTHSQCANVKKSSPTAKRK